MEDIIYKVEVPNDFSIDVQLCSKTIFICEDGIKCSGGKNQEYIYTDYNTVGYSAATKLFPYALIVFGKNDDEAKNDPSLYVDKCSICFCSKRTDVDKLNDFAMSVLKRIKEVIKEKDKGIILTTTDNVYGYTVNEYLDVIFGTDIYLVGGLLGGGLVSQEGLFEQAINTVKSHLIRKATGLGADAVIGIKQSFTSPGGTNDMILVLTGTAVKLKKIY